VPVVPTGPVGTRELLEAWPAVLDAISKKNRTAWIVVVAAQVRSLEDDLLTLVFGNENDAASFRPQKGVPGGVHEILRQAIVDTLGVRVQFKISTAGQVTQPIDRLTTTGSIPVPGFDQSTSVKPTREFATPLTNDAEADADAVAPAGVAPSDAVAPSDEHAPPEDDAPPEGEVPSESDTPPADDDGWNVVSIPNGSSSGGGSSDADSDDVASVDAVLNSYVPSEPVASIPENNRYGESVVREILNASFISEETAEPVRPASTGMEA
jgi:DNA polymerase-3 subunit gamma/tau